MLLHKLNIDSSILQRMKAVVTSFFLLIFSIQILPVSELGKTLFKNQLANEIHEGETGTEDSSSGSYLIFQDDNSPYTLLAYYNACKWQSSPKTRLSFIQDKNFSKQYTPDILTPPPNSD